MSVVVSLTVFSVGVPPSSKQHVHCVYTAVALELVYGMWLRVSIEQREEILFAGFELLRNTHQVLKGKNTDTQVLLFSPFLLHRAKYQIQY